MQRRTFIGSLLAVSWAKSLLANQQQETSRLGICTFSCHRHWNAVRQGEGLTKFRDAPSFYEYTRSIGADGVQTSVSDLSDATASLFRKHVGATQGYFEGDIRLPQSESELPQFERAVLLTKLAGATVARSVLSGSRRYETWTSVAEIEEYKRQAVRRLAMVEPVLQRQGFKLAIENHKDLTSIELISLMKEISSEWIGVNVDTGNNLALLEDPYETIEALAPFALTVHLKDMAMQKSDDGFLLSEVPCGEGFLDLPRIVRILREANPNIAFNLEMATRDPLRIPCLTPNYWLTFPERRMTHLDRAMSLVAANPPRSPVPRITGLNIDQQLIDEESNNQRSLDWMHHHLA
jgi:3-oxoisoapionate decarboxylase